MAKFEIGATRGNAKDRMEFKLHRDSSLEVEIAEADDHADRHISVGEIEAQNLEKVIVDLLEQADRLEKADPAAASAAREARKIVDDIRKAIEGGEKKPPTLERLSDAVEKIGKIAAPILTTATAAINLMSANK